MAHRERLWDARYAAQVSSAMCQSSWRSAYAGIADGERGDTERTSREDGSEKEQRNKASLLDSFIRMLT